jgi:dihydroneopterin aldolase
MKVIIKNMRLDASVGIYDHEKAKKQPLIINVEALLKENETKFENATIDDVFNYEILVQAIRDIVLNKHIDLLETIGERIIAFALSQKEIVSISVQLEKPAAFADMDAIAISMNA